MSYILCPIVGLLCALIGGYGGFLYSKQPAVAAIRDNVWMTTAAFLAILGVIAFIAVVYIIIYMEFHSHP